MITKLFSHILSGILGIFLAGKFIPGAVLQGSTESLLIAGTILGLVNFSIKPILKLISLPLRILTLGLFTLVINAFLVWLVIDILFPKALEISGIVPLLLTTLIVSFLNIILHSYKKHG